MTDPDRRPLDPAHPHLRLLPWASADGRPCYLWGDTDGRVARLADDMEAAQMDTAADLLTEAHGVLAARAWTQGELHFLAVRLTDSLRDVHRIAESRGARLPAPARDEAPLTRRAAGPECGPPDAPATPAAGAEPTTPVTRQMPSVTRRTPPAPPPAPHPAPPAGSRPADAGP